MNADSLRQQIWADIQSIVPLDELEADHRENALNWIDSGSELCRRVKPATPPKHLVSYFPVVTASHILLVDHINAQLWLPCGGHVEPGEHPLATVRREVREELCVEANLISLTPLFITVQRLSD